MVTTIKEEIVQELHRPIRKKYPRRRVIIKGLDDLWQADLIEMQLYTRENKGFRYIFVVIDCFSKYVWCVPLKDKTAKCVSDAMKSVLITSKRTPKNLQTDLGKEFYNSQFSHLLEKYKINHYSTFTILKACIVERVIRTIKEKLYIQFSLRGNYKYYDILDKIINEYNNKKHRTIGMRPCDVTKDNETELLQTVYSHIKTVGLVRKFKVNDIVRISKQKTIFEKGYTPNWTTELFKIAKVKLSNPIVYFLKDMNDVDIKGAFYTEELSPAKYKDVYLVEKVLRRKGNKVYVKWLGLDKSHNSWIAKTNVL